MTPDPDETTTANPLPTTFAAISLLTEVVRRFLGDYLRLVDPDTAARLDLQRITLLPLPQDSPLSNGVLAEVSSQRGDEVIVLVLVEPEALGPDEVSDLLGRWFKLLELRFVQPILLNIVYLHGGCPGPTLETASMGTPPELAFVRLFFTAFSLARARGDYYLNRSEPLAWALASSMRYLRGSRQDLAELCRARIAAARLDEPDHDLLLRFVDAVAEAVESAPPNPRRDECLYPEAQRVP